MRIVPKLLLRGGPLPFCLALLACAPAPAPPLPQVAAASASPPAAPAQPAAQPTPVAASADIFGEWDVASFEDHRPARLSGTIRAAFADFGEGGVRLRIECNYSGRAGSVRNGRFVHVASDRMQTAMWCGPVGNAREQRFFTLFERNPSVERLGPDRLRISDGASQLILERPAVRRLDHVPTPAEILGTWRLTELTRYLPGGGHSGIGLSDLRGRLEISGDRILFTTCPDRALRYRFAEGGILETTGGAAGPRGAGSCELGGAPQAPALPAPLDIIELLQGDPMVERAGPVSLLISTPSLGLLITRGP